MTQGSDLNISDSLVARLENYRLLISRVDDLCRGIETQFHSSIVCADGCDGCCRHLSLFPVEAVSLAAALRQLPLADRDRIQERARDSLPTDSCPLLWGHHCLLYPARPLICRTHGLPLLMKRDGRRQVDYCPRNFQGVASLPGRAIIDLDRLNETLVAVNLRFIAASSSTLPWPERLTVAEALLLDPSALTNQSAPQESREKQTKIDQDDGCPGGDVEGK